MLETNKVSNLTIVLAIWGAILSSVTFGWTLYRDIRDRAKIKLSAQVRRIGQRIDGAYFSVDPGAGIEGASEELYIVLSVVNVGRRPVRWKGAGGLYKTPVNGKSGFVLSARFLPKMLDEQDAHDEFTELDSEFKRGNIKRFYIWDAAGNEWNISRREINKLLADAQKFSQLT